MDDFFFEIHHDLPREGPGDSASTRRAFSCLGDLPRPRILDVGCGPGLQTLELAELAQSNVFAMDTHAPFLSGLKQRARRPGASGQVIPVRGSMFALPFAAHSLDLIWSEGAIYIMGFEKGLRSWRSWLKPGGYVAVTEISWLRPQPPPEIYAYWLNEYPEIRATNENLARIQSAGYRVVDHFALPPSAWWDDYYSPLEKRVAMLRDKHRNDAHAVELLDREQLEMDMHRKYSDWYSYVFYIMQIVW